VSNNITLFNVLSHCIGIHKTVYSIIIHTIKSFTMYMIPYNVMHKPCLQIASYAGQVHTPTLNRTHWQKQRLNYNFLLWK